MTFMIYSMFMMLLQHKWDAAYQVNHSICAGVPCLLHVFYYLFSALKDQLPPASSKQGNATQDFKLDLGNLTWLWIQHAVLPLIIQNAALETIRNF